LSFINLNWYIALAFCLFFFIGGRQLAEIPVGTPRARGLAGLLLFLFAAPALLFPLAYLPLRITASPWYNTFRSIDRIELFSSLIAPAAGYATYMKPDLPYKGYPASVRSPVLRIIKPLAFPFCILLISVNFIGPLLRPLDKNMTFNDFWAEGGVFIQSATPVGGPAALISAMHSLNNFADNELDTVKGTYTDRSGTEFWYLARYAVNRGYRTRFFKLSGIGEAPVPSIFQAPGLTSEGATHTGTGGYIALLERSRSGMLTVGDPSQGMLELSAEDFEALYGVPDLLLALSVPKSR